MDSACSKWRCMEANVRCDHVGVTMQRVMSKQYSVLLILDLPSC